MKPQTLSRICGGISTPLALVVLILFFVPWVELKCNATPVGTASGLQLTYGGMTTSSQFESERAEQDAGGDADARPGFMLGLLIPLGLLVVCGLMLAGKLRPLPGGGVLALLAIGGLVVMICAANVDYADEIARAEARQSDEPSWISSKDMASMFDTETLAAVWVGLALYILTALVGLAGAILPFVLARLGAVDQPQGGATSRPAHQAQPPQSKP